MASRLSKEAFGELVEQALAELPEQFQAALEDVRLEVRDRPTPKMLRDAEVGRGHTLLGLYQGRPVTVRSVEDSAALPDVIYLFQAELEEACSGDDELREQIRTTVLHELGHYFGLDEDDLDELGYS